MDQLSSQMGWRSLKARQSVFAKKFFGSNDRGNAAVEFALVLPAFLGFVFSGYYAGLTAFDMHTVHYSLTKAARALQLNPSLTQSQVQTLVSDGVSKLSGGSGVTITLTKGALANGAQLDTATASYPLTFTVPLIGTYTYNYSTSVTVAVAAS